MTSSEFGESEGWLTLGRFSHISSSEDGQREFLEAIPAFFAARSQGLPPEGFSMPDIVIKAVETQASPYGEQRLEKSNTRVIGKIMGLDFVPDNFFAFANGKACDGMIIYKPAQPTE